MSKLKAVVLKGPDVVKNAVVYGFNYGFERARSVVSSNSLPFHYTREPLIQSLFGIADGLIRVFGSSRELERSVAAFKTEWTGKNPLTETRLP